MTNPQRRKLVASGAIIVSMSLIFYLTVFGFQALDLKSLILFLGFFGVASKVATIKHGRNPLV